MFTDNLGDSQLNAQFTELVAPKRFRQNVSELLLSPDMFNIHLPISNAIPNEMITNIYVLTSFMENGILTDCNCGLTVHLQSEFLQLLTLQL